MLERDGDEEIAGERERVAVIVSPPVPVSEGLRFDGVCTCERDGENDVDEQRVP